MPTCSVENCPRAPLRRKMCGMHYARFRRLGDPLAGGIFHGEPLKFVETAVQAKTKLCILWPFGKNTDGYGVVWDGTRVRSASSLVCERTHGPRPPRHEASHSCGIRHCVNPAHLRWDTHKGNMDDRERHGTVPHTRGEDQGSAKLTEAVVRAIRADNRQTRQVDLAKKYGVGQATISRVLLRLSWGHVS